jgi:hypothetical protein
LLVGIVVVMLWFVGLLMVRALEPPPPQPVPEAPPASPVLLR